jgi:1,4-dihydroxy-6-naphthoate synthase
MALEELCKSKIAVPGKMTSAFLLLQLMTGKFDYVEMKFSEIPAAVRDGLVDAGLVIHETQLSYESEGLQKILDVGEWWHKTTNGLPVPLGTNVMSDKFGQETIRKFDRYLQESIQYGLDHQDETLEYAMKYSRGKPRELIKKFVKMYVNDVTVEMGKPGEDAIRKMFEMAVKQNLIAPFEIKISQRS